jgi:phosphoribosylformylglycinamidine synthase
MKIGIVRFPGSNCEQDCFDVCSRILGLPTVYLWHKEHDLADCDCIVLPGGFSYGDYLRAGAMAGLSPIMTEVKAFAGAGGYVLGICNGFQILAESGLLPGALLRNENLHFVCGSQALLVENTATPYTGAYRAGQVVSVPIAHGEGRYYIDAEGLARLEGDGRIVFRYADRDGASSRATNPNGSLANIAGIISENGRVLGMMPHPERVCDPLLGGEDGLPFFRSLVASLEAGG